MISTPPYTINKIPSFNKSLVSPTNSQFSRQKTPSINNQWDTRSNGTEMVYGNAKGTTFDMMSRNESQMQRFEDLSSQGSQVMRVVNFPHEIDSNDDNQYGHQRFNPNYKSPEKLMQQVGQIFAFSKNSDSDGDMSSYQNSGFVRM